MARSICPLHWNASIPTPTKNRVHSNLVGDRTYGRGSKVTRIYRALYEFDPRFPKSAPIDSSTLLRVQAQRLENSLCSL
jgi:hypothetical protein